MHAIDLKGFDHPLPNLLSVIIKINLEDAFRVRADGVAPPWSRDGRSPPAGPQSPAVRVSLPGWAESESTCRVGEPLPAVRPPPLAGPGAGTARLPLSATVRQPPGDWPVRRRALAAGAGRPKLMTNGPGLRVTQAGSLNLEPESRVRLGGSVPVTELEA